jgi:hypothetical protein
MILLKRSTNSNVDTLIKIMIPAIFKKYIQIFPIIDTVFIIFISFIFIIITPSSGQNTAPTADAGPRQIVNAGDIVTLDANNSNDPNEDSLNYRWRQVAGKNVMLSDIHIANPTFIAPNVSTLTNLKFELVVDDGIYSSSPSYVEIVVNPIQKSSAAAPSYTNSSSQSQQSRSNNLGLLVFLLLLFSAAAWYVLRGHRKHRERRYFPESVKRQKLREQNYKCAICKRSAGVWDYDHIDGNRSNNNPHNLQALCPNCHAKKSRGLLKQEKRSSFLQWLKIAAIIILFFIILTIIINLLPR